MHLVDMDTTMYTKKQVQLDFDAWTNGNTRNAPIQCQKSSNRNTNSISSSSSSSSGPRDVCKSLCFFIFYERR
ncbi:hypothetical protein M0804_002151 [Polistes exclamans]|nr:hypothetical protein M0804_002151 [Polistes exclamans]